MVTFQNITKTQVVQQAMAGVGSDIVSMRFVNGQLWCCRKYDINVLDTDLTQQKMISKATGENIYVLDVAETRNGDIVIATGAGIYLRSTNELHFPERRHIDEFTHISQLSHGLFTCVVIHQNH